MAYVEGDPGEKTGQSVEKHVGLAVVVVIIVVGVMLFSAENWRKELPTVLVIATAVVAFILFASYKVNPMGWHRLFRRAAYERMMNYDRMVADLLDDLDDNYFIFHNFIFELFHIENLVISTRGIFIVAKIGETAQLHIHNNILHAGETPLDTLTGNLWRMCHLMKIVYEKAYQQEIMPNPLLVVPGADTVAVDHFEGIKILTLDKLKETIEKDQSEVIKLDTAQSFAYYIKKRYL